MEQKAAAATWSLYFSLLNQVRTLMQDAEARSTLRASTRFVVGKREYVLQCSVRNSLFELDEEDLEEKVLRWSLPR
ncbi:hypothetical protein, conserved [Eimeria necatrix]|uniref:Uncharacterized protein n=1 Tax=Eimeria necatrix TaxID=51315 RepID=U6N4V7_9EIME|nr:hypothetical protein, conserved [Eimeria necatrix]CDJ68970.1 hypothetical protein, conserved [Eimeria necatrix]